MTAKRRPANAARHGLWRLEAYTYLASVVHIGHVQGVVVSVRVQ